MFREPQRLRPLPSYYFSPSTRGAYRTSAEGGAPTYESRKMEGTLGGFFNVMLAGERASGTAIYGLRKSVGLSSIDWIEQAEPGDYGYRRISPSEAIGIKGYDDKFWTARGLTSLGLDIVLDPTTYIGVGLIGKGAKLTSMAAKSFGKGSVRVGTQGAAYLARASARGLSREAAEKELISYMSLSPTVHSHMMSRGTEKAVKFMGQPIMKTTTITGPMGQLWRAAPMLESRSSLLDAAHTAFTPFHKLTQQLGARAADPFKEFYRATGVGRTKWDRYIQRMTKGVPEEWGEAITRNIELGTAPNSNIAGVIDVATRHKEEYARMYSEKVGAGLLKEDQFISGYMAHVPTESAMRYSEKRLPKLAGRRREDTAAAYLRTLHSGKERLLTEDVFSANVYMRSKTGIEQWFETDPFIALQKYGAEHIIAMQSEKLRLRVATEFGFKGVASTSPKYTMNEIDRLVAKRMNDHQLANPMFSKRNVAIAYSGKDEILEEVYGRMSLVSPVFSEVVSSSMPYTELSSIVSKARHRLSMGAIKYADFESVIKPLTSYIESEKHGIFTRKISQTNKIIDELRSSVSAYQKSGDVAAQFGWGAQRIDSLLGQILSVPPEKALTSSRRVYKASLMPDETLRAIQADDVRAISYGPVFGRRSISSKRPYTPDEVSAAIGGYRRGLEGTTVGGALPRTFERGGVLYQLEKGDYIPTEAFAEYTKRIPVSGAWTRMETKFKKTLTSVWPAFHARNLYGMIGWQNMLAGVGARGYVTNLDVMRKTSPWMAKHAAWAVGDTAKMFDVPFMGKKTAAQMRDMAEHHEVYGITGMVDVSASYTAKRAGIVNKLERVYEAVPQELMVGVESIGRGGLFWDRVMKGVPASQAARDVEKFHFKYGQGALTTFESDYVRHGFLFYRWMRGNIPLQAQMSVEKPGMYAGLGKIYERSRDSDTRDRLADWQKERFGFAAGNTFVSLDLPFYEHPMMFFDPRNLEDIYFAMSPAIKFPVGITAGRDPATGAPIEDWGARGRYAVSQFAGRGMYAQREVAKTLSGERKVSWTVAHQLGGVGVYELSPNAPMSGMSAMSSVPGDLRRMGVSQDSWTEYNLASGWTPKMTSESRASVYQQHGGRCSVCGKPCSPDDPCRSQLIVPVEMGGTYSPDNTALVCSSCSGTYSRNIAPMMQAQHTGLQVPIDYQTSFADKSKVFGLIDEYMNQASLVE